MSNFQELPPASSGASGPTPTDLLSRMPIQSSAESTNQPLPGLKLSLSVPTGQLVSTSSVQHDNKDIKDTATGMANLQSVIETPFINWKRNCYTLFEVDEKVSSPNEISPMMASSEINQTDPVTMNPYQALTVSSLNWKYQVFRNVSSEVEKRRIYSENQSSKSNKFLYMLQGQNTCEEMNASLASTNIESDLGARKSQQSSDLKTFDVGSTTFGFKRNHSTSDLKALVGSIFNISSNTTGGKSKSVPASPVSSPKSQKKTLAFHGEGIEKTEGMGCLDLQAAGTLSSSQSGNVDQGRTEHNAPIYANKTGLKKTTPPTTMMSSIVDWATKKKITVSNSEMNIFAPPSS